MKTISRRSLVKTALASWLAMFLPGMSRGDTVGPRLRLRRSTPASALVLWYSQTGHTRRYANYIASIWKKQGISVATSPLQQMDPVHVRDFDLIALGTPVHYLDIPENVRTWVAGIPRIDGAGVAAFASYGGSGDGQHNVAVNLLGSLAMQGGVPLGVDTFGNMSTYPPTWSLGNSARILKYRDKPDRQTYARVKGFAAAVLDRYANNSAVTEHAEFRLDGFMKGAPTRYLSKAMIGHHVILPKRCLRCGTCTRTCPSGAIDLAHNRVDSNRCLLCFGCVNNCPVGAHEVTILGRAVYGFPEFLRENNITIMEAPES